MKRSLSFFVGSHKTHWVSSCIMRHLFKNAGYSRIFYFCTSLVLILIRRPEFECHNMNLNTNCYLELLHYSFSFYCNSTTENRLGNCLPTCLTLTTLSSPHYMIYAEQTNSTTRQSYIYI